MVVEGFAGARIIAGVLKVVGFAVAAVAVVLFVVTARDAQGGVALAFVTFVPVMLTSALLVLFSEIARAVISTAESSFVVKDELAAIRAVAASGQAAKGGQGTPNTQPAKPVVETRDAATSSGVARANQVLQTWKGHNISATGGRQVRVGSRQFSTVNAARAAIEAGEFD